MKLQSKFFNELEAKEIYEILKSRSIIFRMEQNIKYVDEDDTDYESLHCYFQENGKVVAYLRAYYKKGDLSEARIGRVLTLEHGKGMGTELIEKSIVAIKEKMNVKRIGMDAQKHAIGFYERLGFVVTSDEFLEEGIVHVNMEIEV